MDKSIHGKIAYVYICLYPTLTANNKAHDCNSIKLNAKHAKFDSTQPEASLETLTKFLFGYDLVSYWDL